MRRTVFCVFWFPILCCAQTAIAVTLATPEALRTRLERGLVAAKARQAAVHALFNEAGCATEDQRVSRNAANVICKLSGESESMIVVGAHFDFAERGEGIVDDWSGTAMLPSLYEALRAKPRKHTFVFVAFTEEETGLNGSSRFVKELNAEQRTRVRAFVNLECLGLGKTNVWGSRATPSLLSKLKSVSHAIHEEVPQVNVELVGDDDSHPFLSAHLPVITLHSLTQETIHILHSSKDRISAIRMDDYFASYKLTAVYLAYLDSVLD